MAFSEDDIDKELGESRQRLRTLEQRIQEKDPTLQPNAGYIAHMARKYNNRLGALKQEREMLAHRYFTHQDQHGVQVIVCSCGGVVPGDFREMGEKAFLEAEGHVPYEGEGE